MKRTRIAAATIASLALLTLSACGDDDSDNSSAKDSSGQTSSQSSNQSSGQASDQSSGQASDGSSDEASTDPSGGSGDSGATCTTDDVTVDGGFGEKPTITIPDDCQPPSELLSKDLVEGSGDPAVEGDTVVTDYLLATWSDGAVVDNSFDRGQPFPVQDVGNAPVIEGWNQGLVGITPGTRRLLIIPPDLGYGPAGSGPIGPDETLVFVVDAVSVEQP